MLTPKNAAPLLIGIILIGIVAVVFILKPLLESPREEALPESGQSSPKKEEPTSEKKYPTQKESPPIHKTPFKPHGSKPRIVVIRNTGLRDASGKIDDLEMKRTLNEALRRLFQADSGKAALKKIIGPTDKVGLKINTYLGRKNNATHLELVNALTYFLKEINVPENNIIIWDRSARELKLAGYKFNLSDKGIRCLATMDKARTIRGINPKPIIGYETSQITVGQTKTRLSKILTQLTTVTINMPVLKTHKFKENIGVNTALLNMYHAIEINSQNKTELYANECDPAVAEVYSTPHIRSRTRLIICDALNPLYNGGPMDDPRYHTKYNALIVGFDPVAIDIVGQSILQKIRQAKGAPNWPDLVSNYLFTAGSLKYQLGQSHLDWIDIIEKTLQ